jgi:hypothetical protein
MWDSNQTNRARLGVWEDGTSGLEISDPNGANRTRLGQRPDDSTTLDFWDRDGNYSFGLGEGASTSGGKATNG